MSDTRSYHPDAASSPGPARTGFALAALPVGVPAAVAYFVLVGSIGAGRLGGGGPLIGSGGFDAFVAKFAP